MKSGPKEYVHKRDIDRLVGAKFGMSTKRFAPITSQFFHEIMLQLVDGKGVTIPNVGEIWMQAMRPSPVAVHLNTGKFKKGAKGKRLEAVNVVKYRVHFVKGRLFKKLVLEKYGKAKTNKEDAR